MVTSKNSLPTIKELFKESWSAFTKSILNLFLLSIISLITCLIFIIIFSGIVVVWLMKLGVFKAFSSLQQGDFSILNSLIKPQTLIAGGIILLIFILLMTIISYVIKIAMVMVVAKYQEQLSLGSIIKKSFGYIVPLFLVGLLTGLLSLGGFFVFIIPVFFFCFFFMFVSYEVILANKKWLNALRGSVQIVSQHFGEILVRMVLYLLLYIALVVFIPNLIRKIEPTTYLIISIYSIFTNVLIGFFGFAFSITLYKQVKKATDENKSTSLAWIWIIAILGWLLMVLYIYGSVKLIGKMKDMGIMEKIQQEILKETNKGKEPKITTETEENFPAKIEPSVINVPVVPVAPSCTTFNIREGEFSSNKCYSQKDYDDLMYYLQRFNSAVFSYNGAIASMNITCSGSDFFKDSCERDKKQKEQAESDMNNYRGTIQGIIARGK